MEIGIGKAHDFIVEIEKDLGHCKMDKRLLSHILNNLLSNAFKYSNSDTTVKLHLAKNNNTIEIQVIDQGMGMDEETAAKIFDSFYRAKNVTNIEGTGMGLSILNNSIKMPQRVKANLLLLI